MQDFDYCEIESDFEMVVVEHFEIEMIVCKHFPNLSILGSKLEEEHLLYKCLAIEQEQNESHLDLKVK